MLSKLFHGRNIHHFLTKWLPFQQSVFGVCLILRKVTALWLFIERPGCNVDVVILQCHQSEGGMNNFAAETVSVIKG
jgi:hypothetical protein